MRPNQRPVGLTLVAPGDGRGYAHLLLTAPTMVMLKRPTNMVEQIWETWLTLAGEMHAGEKTAMEPELTPMMEDMLAGRSPSARREMLLEMLDMLSSMPAERAAKQMREMVRGLAGLDDAGHRRVVEERTYVLAGFPPRKQWFLVCAHRDACRQLPRDLTEREMALARAITEALPPARRQALRAQMDAVLAG